MFLIISTLADKNNSRKQTLIHLNAHRIMGEKHDGKPAGL